MTSLRRLDSCQILLGHVQAALLKALTAFDDGVAPSIKTWSLAALPLASEYVPDRSLHGC